MSTIYTFHRELASLATPAVGDRILTADRSTGTANGGPTKKDMLLSVVKTAARGTGTADLIGFYGASPVDQGTMTATAVTALTTNPTFSASNTGAGVFGFASSTVAVAYVTRVTQMQADIDTLMARVNSTGLVNITGL
jgi:hypothetical protein